MRKIFKQIPSLIDVLEEDRAEELSILALLKPVNVHSYNLVVASPSIREDEQRRKKSPPGK